jgi:hypothetical protein
MTHTNTMEQHGFSCEHCGCQETEVEERACDYCGDGMCMRCTIAHDEAEVCPMRGHAVSACLSKETNPPRT